MKTKVASILFTGLFAFGTVNAADVERENIAQVALLQSLAQGYFDGTVTVGELRTLGNIGIGTFKGLNGEMILLDGICYQALGDGRVVVAADSEQVPFANATFFDNDISVKITEKLDKAALEKQLTQIVQENGSNSFYMVKLHTTFPYILFRSEYGSQRPYGTLVEALKGKQTEFTERNINGTLVGLYCPNYAGGLNSVGWHFHFISDDRKHGGHILELSVNSGEVQFDKTDKLSIYLHDDKEFQNLNLAKDMSEDIRHAEQDSQK